MFLQKNISNRSKIRKKLIGNRLAKSLAEVGTKELWPGFMPKRKETKNPITVEKI